MNRIIKFRGKRVRDGAWVEGSLVHKFGHHGHPTIVNAFMMDIVDVKTVGQYAAHDLYEGDIFHLGDPRIKYVVVWHDTGFMGKQVGAHGSYVGLEHWATRIEKLGNIYDNPELIEGEEV